MKDGVRVRVMFRGRGQRPGVRGRVGVWSGFGARSLARVSPALELSHFLRMPMASFLRPLAESAWGQRGGIRRGEGVLGYLRRWC